jgi:anthranilate phosphoribosyltransferase
MVVCGQVGSQLSVVTGRSTTEQGESAGTADKPGAVAYLDELSTLGDNTIAEFYQKNGFTSSILTLEEFPIQAASLKDLQGADCDSNAQLVVRLLKGEERGPKRDAVLLNGAAALFVAGRARSLAEGWGLVAEIIDTGAAFTKLKQLQQF